MGFNSGFKGLNQRLKEELRLQVLHIIHFFLY